MSFILDALKKSEAERRQGEVPRLQNEPLSPPPRRRPAWPLLLALALLLNGVVFGWWLLSREEKPAPVAVADGSRAAGSGPAGSAAEVPAGRVTVPPGETAPGIDPVSAAAAPSQPSAVPSPPVEPEVVEVAVGEPLVPSAAAVPAPAKAVEGPAPAPRAESPAAAPARPKTASAAPAADAYPPLSELPGNVRSGLPGLELQLHFFTPEPERRLVRLNGLNLREGDRGGEGLIIVEITPDGVKLAHGGVRFFLPAGRR